VGISRPSTRQIPPRKPKPEIEETLFSRDESQDIPVELHTQFFKSSNVAAKLSIVARIDVSQFKREDPRFASDGFHSDTPD